MIATLTASLFLLQLAATDTAAVAADAYLDPAARGLVQEARARRATVEGAIVRYRAMTRSRVSIGVRALSRDRLFYRCESASRIDWRRDAPTVVEVLGAREAMPMMSARIRAEDDECIDSSFDPADDRLAVALGGLIGSDSAFVRHPLAPGSEAHYRFRSGDTTTIRLPDGQRIRLLELRLLPRRSDPHLVSGSLWLDDNSRAVVRAVLRLARPIDFERDLAEEDDDVPAFVKPGGDIKFFAVEYGLFHQKWWLPRSIAVDGLVTIGTLARMPMRVEQTYEEYEVEGSTGAAVAAPADSGARPAVGCRRDVSVSVGGAGGGGVERRSVPRDSLRPSVTAPPGKKVVLGCECQNRRCRQVDRIVPIDSTELIDSPHLPASIYAQGEALLSEAEMKEILAQVQRGAAAPWQLGELVRPTLTFASPELVRYNRVEGLTLGARADVDLGRAAVDARVRVGLAGPSPTAELGVTRLGPLSRWRAAAYHRLSTVGVDADAHSLGGSLSALLFGRDEHDYFRGLGAELTRGPAGGGNGVYLRLYGERQRAAVARADFSLAGLLGDADFRPNLRADAASQVGAELTWRASRGLDPAGWRGSAALSLRGETGTFAFARPALSLLGTAPLPGALLGSLELAGGGSAGRLPTQALWYLGGTGTVRGYAGNVRAGDSFWRARAEVARPTPGARLVLFSDAGWAGRGAELELDPPLLSAGVGASFLDGLVRLDLARALRSPRGWRLDLHLDAPL